MITIGTSKTWAYINSQLDRKKRYSVHVSDTDFNPICGHGRPLDEIYKVDVDWFLSYRWGCKLCKKMLTT